MPPKRSASGARSSQTISSSSSRRLKRPAEDDWDPSSEETDEDFSPEERRRAVAWDSNLERGPTPSAPSRQSPDRSAMRRSPEALQAAELERQLQSDVLASMRPLSRGYQTYSNPPKASSGSRAQQSVEHVHEDDGRSRTNFSTHARAQAAFRKGNESNPLRQLFKHVVGEEDKDIAVCMAVHDLRALIVDYAHAFAAHLDHHKANAKVYVDRLCTDAENAQLVRYIGCLAQGGPSGAHGWGELLADRKSMAALIVAIVGNALKEHVFSELWFGGTDAQTGELHELQRKQTDGDGYARTKARAKHCARYAKEDDSKAQKPYAAAQSKMVLSIEKLLEPLLFLAAEQAHSLPPRLSDILRTIVEDASRMSREFRLCGEEIYHWSPTFKDEEFNPDHMECFNLEYMIKESPYKREVVNGRERSILVGAPERSEAIVQVVVFPGLVVHRQKGGSLAKRLLAEERRDQALNLPPDVLESRRRDRDNPEYLTGAEGYRTRTLCKSVVHLVWGKQRLLTREAGTSAHLDAMRDGKMQKYADDRKGHVELFDYFRERGGRGL